MAVQFAGSGDRRRRRLAVCADESIDTTIRDGEAGEIESELVASEAAAPWVPVTEFRIWIYATLIAVLLGALTFIVAYPIAVHEQFVPLFNHLFEGSRPLAIKIAQTAFLLLSTQMGLLIAWYRSRCKLDFSGRYRVWPWVIGLIGFGAFCSATNIHHVIGEMIAKRDWLPWRAATVAWLLPICVSSLPISLLIDRDVRKSPSSLFMLRISGTLWLGAGLLEIYQPELKAKSWYKLVEPVVPLFASATLFLGLWLHARIVAYVCPDPPELDQRSAGAVVWSVLGWIAGCLLFWRRSTATVEDEAEEKPKRRRKKTEGEEAAPRRKRRTAKRSTGRSRSRTKPADEEEESGDVSTEEESEVENEVADESSTTDESSWEETEESSEEYEEPPVKAPTVSTKTDGRFSQIHSGHGSSVPAPHSRNQKSSWEEDAESEQNSQSQSDEYGDDADNDQEFDSQATSDQMKGLSKRQKREMRKQMREQQRTRGR